MSATLYFADATSIAQAAASKAVEDLTAAITVYGSATWVIAGGSTPLVAYKLMAARAINTLDWSKVMIVIGDERCVPFDSPDAGWSQAEETLLRYLPLAASVKRPATDLSAEQAADQYDSFLRQLPLNAAGLPRLDHVWLGIGEDGHTLSLFPNHPSSQTNSGERLVIAVHDSPKPPPDRISLSFKALEGVDNCLILASGQSKADAVSKALNHDMALPIARAAAIVEAAGGNVSWFIDEAAAGGSHD